MHYLLVEEICKHQSENKYHRKQRFCVILLFKESQNDASEKKKENGPPACMLRLRFHYNKAIFLIVMSSTLSE